MQELAGDVGRQLVNAIAFGDRGERLREVAAVRRRGGPPPAVRARRTAAAAASPARELQVRNATWWKQPNVVGMAVGRKRTAGRLGELSLVVFVKRKLALARLPAGRRVPSTLDAPQLGIRGQIPVDVQKVGKGRAEALVSANRPAQPGFSVGNRIGGSGTIGCVVRDRASSSQFGLTCAHVLAPVPSAAAGDRVLVPSLAEARASHVLARAPLGALDRFVPPTFSDSTVPGNLDVATFLPSDPVKLDSKIAIVGRRPSGVAASITVGTPVRKVGASSELTSGEVKLVHMLFWLAYPTASGGEVSAGFDDLIGVTHFSDPGDSGSLVITDSDEAVGLVLGSAPEFTVCLPIQRVLDALNCDLVTA